MFARCLPVIVMVLLVALQAPAQTAFTFEAMMELKRISDPQVSPDGQWVLFSAVEVNLGANTRTPHLWIVPADGGAARQITRDPAGSPAGETRGRWAPDSKGFLYVSSKSGTSQIWAADFDNEKGDIRGTPRPITSLSTGADGGLWSPDGRHILFVSSVYPDCPDDACNKARDTARSSAPVKAQIFTRLLFRHWDRYLGEKRTHLFIQAIDADGTPAGNAVDLTPGDFDAPIFTLGGGDQYAFSPDGREVCFVANRDPVPAVSTNNDLWIVPIKGGQAVKVPTGNPASDSLPAYSPDGRYLAYVAQKTPGYESDRYRLMLYEWATGKIIGLTEDWDRWVIGFAWAPDSRRIYFTSEDAGELPIYYIDIPPAQSRHPLRAILYPPAPEGAPRTQDPITLISRGSNDALTLTPNGKSLIFTRSSIQAPAEIYRIPATPRCDNESSLQAIDTPARAAGDCRFGPLKQLTDLNRPVLARVQLQPPESFWYAGAEGKRVQGFMLKPPDFDPGKQYPVKLLVHGGPQGAWGYSWSYRWNPQLFAAPGYVVLMINPRGSTGYGQKFIDAINGDWGGRAFQDLMLGLDVAEKMYPFIDKNRECALGASYGGYMVNWILGHTTRFKCLVSHDGMFNTESAWGTTEELWFNEWEFKGTPWTNPDLYAKWSPHRYAAAFKTPTLVIHGQLDYRLDVSEGLQLFTTLQRRGVPSKMLYFPDEGHWVLKPQNSRLWYQTVNAWTDEWVKK